MTIDHAYRENWAEVFGPESIDPDPRFDEVVPEPERSRPPLGDGATPYVAGRGYARRFPTETLPPSMATYARDLAYRKQVPVDLPALTMLGILGSVAGPRITIRRDLDWRQPTNLYTACALPSGAGKSPTVDELRRGLITAQRGLAERHKLEVNARLVRMRDEVEALRGRANDITTDINERSMLRDEANRLEESAKEMSANPPPSPELIFDGDTTPEALGNSMALNAGAAAVIDDEGTFFRNLGGQYSGGKTANLGLVLVGYDCRYYKPKRVNRATEPIHRAALSLVIAPQPGIVADMMRNQAMDELGFINRFIVCVPGELTGQRTERPSTYHRDIPTERPDRAGRDWWSNLLDEIVQYDVIGETDPEDAPTIDLSRGAWKKHREYEQAFEARLHPGTGDLRKISPWATKHCARVLRIAALLHLASGFLPGEDLEEAVMEQAIAIGEWSIEHFLGAGAVVGLSTDAGRIKEFIDGTELGFCDRTALFKEVFKGHASASELDGWISELVSTGDYIEDRLATGGRPKKIIRRVHRGA